MPACYIGDRFGVHTATPCIDDEYLHLFRDSGLLKYGIEFTLIERRTFHVVHHDEIFHMVLIELLDDGSFFEHEIHRRFTVGITEISSVRCDRFILCERSGDRRLVVRIRVAVQGLKYAIYLHLVLEGVPRDLRILVDRSAPAVLTFGMTISMGTVHDSTFFELRRYEFSVSQDRLAVLGITGDVPPHTARSYEPTAEQFRAFT